MGQTGPGQLILLLPVCVGLDLTLGLNTHPINFQSYRLDTLHIISDNMVEAEIICQGIGRSSGLIFSIGQIWHGVFVFPVIPPPGATQVEARQLKPNKG